MGIILRNHPMADSTGIREGLGATRMHSTCRTHPQTRPHFFITIPSGHVAKDLIMSCWSQPMGFGGIEQSCVYTCAAQ